MKGTTYTAQEELSERFGIERCPECNCCTGDDTEYKDFSNKTIAVCAQCGYEWYLDQLTETKPSTFNLQEITNCYVAKIQEYEKKRDNLRRLQNKHERLKAKYDKLGQKLKYPHWIENYLTPIAEELVKHFPGSHFEISGPFGLDCETSISIDGPDKVLLAFLQFVPGDLDKGEIALRDYKVDTAAFGKGTIGEVNGRNHPRITIPADASIDWFLDKIKYFHDEIDKWESSHPKEAAGEDD